MSITALSEFFESFYRITKSKSVLGPKLAIGVRDEGDLVDYSSGSYILYSVGSYIHVLLWMALTSM